MAALAAAASSELGSAQVDATHIRPPAAARPGSLRGARQSGLSDLRAQVSRARSDEARAAPGADGLKVEGRWLD